MNQHFDFGEKVNIVKVTSLECSYYVHLFTELRLTDMTECIGKFQNSIL